MSRQSLSLPESSHCSPPDKLLPLVDVKAALEAAEANWTIVSYELARTEAIAKALAKGYYDVIILDEAHYLKTIDSRRTRAVFGGGKDRTFEPLASRALIRR